ncbi:MAG TPA: iron-sulfur cluster assembly protein [Solirubrobacterales bacterium]|nr:iron-sulfur cluster assembly protein [Solirubrobacterales bacterium]
MAAAPLKERVLERINAVQDPCSLAQRIPVGLSDMGLVTDVKVSEADAEGRHDVALVLRVTAPGCMYVPFMDRSIKAAVGDLDEVGEITTEWDPEADWSPGEIAEPARKRIAESRARRLREVRERAKQRSRSRS